ncbi:MAG: DegT/DnrJ/EryC1/StrS family aminotransferase [Marinoscillum sp.]
MEYKVSLSKPYITQEDIAVVTEALNSSQLSLGQWTRRFEESFAQSIGTTYAVAVSSGTAALHLSMRALQIAPGDEVITSPFSFIASSNCILYEQGKPVFVDIEEETLGIDPLQVEPVITGRTKAILPVHVFGQACDMDSIMNVANSHSLSVIEDCCEAIQTQFKGKNVGTFGHMSTFGFYPNKQMTTGEGGMLLTNDEQVYRMVKSLGNQGRGTNLEWLVHDQLGYNYRISELTAALGYSQTQKLPEILEKRRELAAFYIEELAGIDAIKLPKSNSDTEYSWFVFHIRVDQKIRDSLLVKLNEKGIQCKAYFYPCIHLQPYYRERFGYQKGMFPIAERVSREVIVLPFFTTMTQEDVYTVKDALVQSLSEL